MQLKDITPRQSTIIKSLWNKNRAYHEAIDPRFGYQYKNLKFEERMEAIFSDITKCFKITTAIHHHEVVGYCLSSIADKTGEVISLHVLDSERGHGIGKMLMMTHMQWMKDQGCDTIGLMVSCANENTIAFYKQLGLAPNLIYMQKTALI